MENYIHLFFTSTILFQNVLSRVGIMNHHIHFNTLLVYTFVDCIMMLKSNKIFSIMLHHLACVHLVYGAINHHPHVNCHDLVVIELTTFLNACHKICNTTITHILKDAGWICIRVILLPIIIIKLSSDLIAYDYELFVQYSFSNLIILILSIEWTNEVFKTDIKYISSIIYIIPIIHYCRICNVLGTLVSIYVCISSTVFNTNLRYENRLLINYAASYMLLL